MLPRIILHNEVSVDGRIDCIAPDIGLFYELASRWKEDATLAGSDTVLKQEEEMPEEDEEAFEPPKKNSGDSRPLLVVPDSKGRIHNWYALRKAGYWRDVVALCSHSTPGTYLDYLKKRHIDYIVAGDHYVDLKAALEELNARYGVGLIRVDSGGTLNGVLLRAGLVDEVSVLFDPSLVGGTSPRSFFRAPDLNSPEGMIKLKLIHFEKIKDDLIWLRYKVVQ
ncbi:MAG: RibD family protein [Candidatus Methanoperedens sp.]|nr:RibD family protein [Candidatus Methanoperedens sp.]